MSVKHRLRTKYLDRTLPRDLACVIDFFDRLDPERSHEVDVSRLKRACASPATRDALCGKIRTDVLEACVQVLGGCESSCPVECIRRQADGSPNAVVTVSHDLLVDLFNVVLEASRQAAGFAALDVDTRSAIGDYISLGDLSPACIARQALFEVTREAADASDIHKIVTAALSVVGWARLAARGYHPQALEWAAFGTGTVTESDRLNALADSRRVSGPIFETMNAA